MVRTKALLKQLLQNKNQNKAARKTKPNTGGIKKYNFNKKPQAGAFKLFKKDSIFIRIRMGRWKKNSQRINNLFRRKIHCEEKYNEVLMKISKIENKIHKLTNKVDFWRDAKDFLMNRFRNLNKAILKRQLKLYKKIKNI